MNLTDIASLEKWRELENQINNRSSLSASVFNIEGIRITDFVKWANRLCPVIKANPKGQNYICAVAHQNIASQARRLGKPIIEECDAGLMKIAVPIFINGEFLGVAGGCGHILDAGEVDIFLINKTTGIEEAQLVSLSDDIPVMTLKQAESHASFIQNEVAKIINEYESSMYRNQL